jgi:hypothetical protein
VTARLACVFRSLEIAMETVGAATRSTSRQGHGGDESPQLQQSRPAVGGVGADPCKDVVGRARGVPVGQPCKGVKIEAPGVSELESNSVVEVESAGLVVGRGMHDMFVHAYTHARTSGALQ